MKKIFYFIASAIVALGAVACQNDIDETIDNNQQTEGYSIKVTIDEQTRIDLGEADANKKRKLTFTEEDVLVVRSADQEGTNYLFEYAKAEGDVYTFTCNTEGVNSLVGTTPHIFYLGGLHESADALIPYGVGVCNTAAENISGIGMYANATCHSSTFGDENNTVTLFAQPMLKFTANEPVTFSTKDETTFLFFVDGSWSKEYTTKTTGEIYLPILASNEQEIEVTVTTESGFNKTLTKAFEENKIYNLGTIEAEEVVETTTVYLVPDWWTSDGANFYAYYWDANGDGNVKMTDEDADGIYECELPNTTTGIIFTRLNPAYDSFGWNDDTMTDETKRVWNQTADLTMPEGDKNHYYIQYECWEVADYVPTTKTTTIYFWPDSDWAQADATFVAQFGDEKINFTEDTAITEYQVYSLTYTGDAASFSILRMSPDGKTQWNKKTGLTLPTDDKNCFFSTGWAESGAAAGYWAALPEVKTSTITITAYNHSDWTSDIYVYAFGTPTAHTAWPGVKLNTVSGNKMTATITVKHFADEQIKFVVNSGSNKTADSNGFDVASAITFYFTNAQIMDEAPVQPNTKLYLIPSGSWKQGNERYAAYFFGDGTGWASMTDTDNDGTYEVTIPTGKNYTNVIFCRMNGSTTANDWNNKWDQTGDLTLPYYGNNVYSISSWSWSAKK